ncbi:MAG: DUF3726 domain-containing protein [Pseudomonas sp.]|uniref:DUF3726 domain-containing protein n=1 Tax=Pseudomonas abieticivorans TaxID=2931382 RepID=UPI0020BD920D|nr:DUF3726 domain-containing protein [Pseudomonas sp. PIA16]MDE1167811.1 DUF3726 domain-containing protein [Pseudomonas sp.]
MTLSLNEIESLCKKAARGAGLSWGLAEEAGKAARWLSAHGLEGPGLLAAQLRRNDGLAWQALAPVIGEGAWQAATLPMCPVIAGATLGDHAYLLATTGEISLCEVACPPLLMPFVSAAAKRLQVPLKLCWPGGSAGFDRHGKAFLNMAEKTLLYSAAPVRCTAMAGPFNETDALQGPLAQVAEQDLSYLESLAERTYVPASEASRLQGAGAGLSDNN